LAQNVALIKGVAMAAHLELLELLNSYNPSGLDGVHPFRQ
jgi:hypothetical protein